VSRAIPITQLRDFVPDACENGAEDPDQLFNELFQKYAGAVRTSEELEKIEIPSRKKLMGEWLYEGDLGFVYGERGSGKTWFVDAIASYLSTGTGLHGWDAPEAANVLLIDGEMPIDSARSRLKGMRQGNPRLHVLHHEMLFNVCGLAMNLTNERVQRVLTAICIEKQIKLLILDNLSCLFSGIKENDADEWEKVLNWLLDLRRRHVAVLIVHHAGVSGRMRGTTRREDAAFWVIQVDEVKDRQEHEKGACFQTIFTKQRNSDSREWTREWSFKTEPNGQISIGCKEISFDEKVFQLIQSGLTSATDIANELGVHKSTVCRSAQRLITDNIIEMQGKCYRPRGFMK
jgi:AAA domain